MRKLLILILITVAVLENLSKAEINPCETKCGDTHLKEEEDETNFDVCRKVQDFLKCLNETCDASIYAEAFKSFEGMKDEVDENNFRCKLEFLSS